MTHRNSRNYMIVATVFLAAACVLLVLSYRVQHRRETVKAPVQPISGIAIQQKMSMGSVEATIQKVSYSLGSATFKAPEGSRYMILDILLKNTSETPFSVLPANDMYVKSTGGAVSYMSPVALDVPFRAGDLLPGESIAGQLSFLVKQSDDAHFYIDASWSGGVMKFKTE